MGTDGAPGTAAQGAETPSYCAVDDIGDKTGAGFALKAEIPW
jgi:hypothetical protein